MHTNVQKHFTILTLKVKPNIQAVIKLEDEHETKVNPNISKKDVEGGGAEVIKLVDADDNQFVMSKGKDSTVPHEDLRFIEVGYIME